MQGSLFRSDKPIGFNTARRRVAPSAFTPTRGAGAKQEGHTQKSAYVGSKSCSWGQKPARHGYAEPRCDKAFSPKTKEEMM